MKDSKAQKNAQDFEDKEGFKEPQIALSWITTNEFVNKLYRIISSR